jgi:SNF2 family DNA or RNA helicase
MVIHNPYANTKKRPRPPDSVEMAPAHQTQRRSTNQSVDPGTPVDNTIGSTSRAPPTLTALHIHGTLLSTLKHHPPTSCTASSTTRSTTKANLDLSFDDGGIDWTAAVQQIDEVVRQPFHPLVDASIKAPPLAIQMVLSSQGNEARNTTKQTLTLERPAHWTHDQLNPAPSRPQSSSSSTAPIPRLLSYDLQRVKPVEDDLRSSLVKNARLSQPLQNGWTLFSHQKKAILQALLMRRMILALDMGLGKTLIGCVWARAFQATYESTLKVICICPVSLMKEWKRTAEEATGLAVEQVGEKNIRDSDTASMMQVCSWAKIPERVQTPFKYVLICDEAHSMQSLEAGRTKAVLQLCKSSRCVGVLLLTGTPMKNGKPANLFPLLKAVKHPFGDHQKEYERHFCDGREKSFGRGRVVWDANGCSNLGQLKEHISSHLLHMTKEACLGDLPPQTRVYKHIPVSSKHQLQHNQALNELASIYSATGKLENAGDAILTAVTRVRQIGSYAKIDATVAIVKDVLQDEPAVVVFTSFAKVAKEVHRKLAESGWHGELLTGETPAHKRQGLVDNFQQGLAPVFVSTFGAGGVGLTLTAAHTIILLDRPWTPGEARQAEDRVRRIGQTKSVTCIWMVAFDLDKQIDQILEQKTNTTNAVLADGDVENQGLAPKISIFQLLKSVLSKAAPQKQTNTLLNYGFSQDEVEPA